MDVLAGDGGRAVGLERSGGGYEEIELFGGHSELVGVRHVPSPGGSRRTTGDTSGGDGSVAPAGVVVCPPTWSDAEINAERELRLARRLASAGMVVQRFAYRHGGPQPAEPGGPGFGSLLHDGRTALAQLADRGGVDRVALVGTRVGALVAVRLARELPGAPLVLWQPVLDPRQYLADAAAAASSAFSSSAPSGGVRALLSSRLGRDLFAPGVVGNLVDELGPQPRPLLLVQLHRRVGLAPGYRDAVGRLRARGFTVDVAYDPTEEEWWEVHEGREPSDDALVATTEWLQAQWDAPREEPRS